MALIRTVVLLLFILTTSAARASVAFDSDGYSKVAPSYVEGGAAWPSSSEVAAPVAITLDASNVTGALSGFFFGTNLPIYVEPDLLANSTDAIVDSGTRFLRYPGGSPANKYLWDCDTDTWPYFAQWSSMCGAKRRARACASRSSIRGAARCIAMNARK